jgi:hypothetical protein
MFTLLNSRILILCLFALKPTLIFQTMFYLKVLKIFPSLVISCTTFHQFKLNRVYHMFAYNFVNTRITSILGLIKLCLSSFESYIAAQYIW